MKTKKQKDLQQSIDFEIKNYVAYYRVSTKKQGRSGLGLEAQKAIVSDKVKDGKIIAEYIEVESGKKNNRTELENALSVCKQSKATLIIAKLDRLSRDVEFIFRLRNSKVEFICCDLPEFNTLTLGVYASVAQYERERIVERIKDALKAKKARGFKLGKPENLSDLSRAKSIESRKKIAQAQESNQRAAKIIQDLLNQGLSLRKIADKLNEYGLSTTSGKKFLVGTVQHIIKLYAISKKTDE